MSERYDADPNQTERGADNPHCSRYLLARGFTTKDDVVVVIFHDHGTRYVGNYLMMIG